MLDDQSRVLLLRHRYRESQAWELPGGFLPRTEGLKEALRRELREETGLQIEVGPLATATTRAGMHVDLCYVARVHGEVAPTANAEILEARFFALDALPPLAPDQQRNLQAGLKALMPPPTGESQ